MSGRARLVLFLGILFFILHALVTTAAVTQVTDLPRDAPISMEFGPSFAAALCVLPLYPFLSGAMPLFFVAALNSAFCAFVAAFLIVRYRWRGLGVLIAVPVLLIAGATVYGLIARSRVERDWSALVSSTGAGPQTENDAAKQVDPFLARLGVNEPVWRNDLLWIDDYLAKQVGRGDDAIDPLPQPVDHFLVAHRWDVDALLPLLAAAHPRWPAKKYDAAGLYRVEKVLLVDALQHAGSGDHAGAWQRVTAAQRLSDAAFLLPRLTPVAYGIWETEHQLGVARKLSPAGRVALAHFDPHRQVIAAIAAQAKVIFDFSAPWYARPYLLLCSAESAASGLREALRIQSERDRLFDLPPANRAEARIPFNPMGILGRTDLSARANRMLLDIEGTERLLAAKSGEAVAAGSRTPNRKWLFDGTTLRLEPPLPAKIPALPTFHTISAGPGAQTPSG